MCLSLPAIFQTTKTISIKIIDDFEFNNNNNQLQLYTAKSQYWLHKAGGSPEHWQFKYNN